MGAPPEAIVEQQWRSGGDDRLWTTARIETARLLAQLAAHYQAELQRGGWQRQDGDVREPVAWSAWTVQDELGEPWQATFTLIRSAGKPGHFAASIVAEWQGEPEPGAGGGWFSYAPLT